MDRRTGLSVVVGLLIVMLYGRRHHWWLLVHVSGSRRYRVGITTVVRWQIRSMHASSGRWSIVLTR